MDDQNLIGPNFEKKIYSEKPDSEKTSVLAEQAKSRIKTLLDLTKEAASIQHSAPEYQDILSEDILEAIDSALEIINKYRDSSYQLSLTEMNKDAVTLGAIEVYVSMEVGNLQGLSSDAESMRKMHKSRKFLDAKDAAEISKLKATDGEAEHLSRVAAYDHYSVARGIETASRVLYNFYQALSHFTDVLGAVANRELKERMIT